MKQTRGLKVQTIQLQIQDSLYNQLMKSGVDIQAKINEFLLDMVDDDYPSISTDEAKKRVSDAVERYKNGTGEYLNSQDYQAHISSTIANLKTKYANH